MGKAKQYLWNLGVNGILASPVIPIGARVRTLRLLGVNVGRGVRVRHRVNITSNRLTLGDGCYVNVGAQIQNHAHVELGPGVALAPLAVVSSTTHDTTDPMRRQGTLEGDPVSIGAGSWVGAAAIVLPGVTVGRGVIIGAGAVVNRDCDDHHVYAGVPAHAVKRLSRTA